MPPRSPAVPIVRTRWGTLGELATASFALAAVSGAALAVPYDAADGRGSIAALVLANAPAAFFRNLHYWSGQACLLATLAHAWDRLRAGTERRPGRGVWLRTVLSLPLLAFILLTGFLLRGDADAAQALRLVTETVSRLPLAGGELATLLFGAKGRLDVVYIQHAAVATVVAAAFIVEHSRRVWPRGTPLVAATLGAGAISLFVSPGLHDGLDPVVKGPWYFLGFQEVLHWTPWPLAAVAGAVAGVAALHAVRALQPPAARRMKIALVAVLAAYAVLCAAGALLRGENWSFSPGWRAGPGDLRVAFVFGATPEVPVPLPMAMGRPEGCLVCHRGVTGLGNAHRPEAVGCASCHGGDVLALDKARAHAGMESIPGNLATAARGCGSAACHAAILPRVERSVMATLSGIVQVDRRVFGEALAPGEPAHVRSLGRTPADTHMRQLCALCHLGAAKTAFGPNGEDTRGGGCNACHLAYGPAALEALRKRGDADPPTAHPALSLDVANAQCFGCHNRSGRIATSYEGWHELAEVPPAAPGGGRGARLRLVEGDRPFERRLPDIHHERGLDCIDCHTSAEVMGDGVAHARKSGQLRSACTDCHAPAGAALRTVPASALDPESRRLLALRAWPGPAATRHGINSRGEPLVNVVVDASGRAEMVRKRTGERLPLKPASRACARDRGHGRLACGSCHTAWAPRCVTCHTSFDPASAGWDWLAGAETSGEWNERAGDFEAGPPALGVRAATAADRGTIETFVPGMVMTLDDSRHPGGRPGTRSVRLYARLDPHTTRREARSCQSCHNDPRALGYGSGELRFARDGATGRWRFTPASPPLAADGLPADAWIPFLGSREGPVSTRDDARPFTVEEQRRILTVGACLTCHDGRAPPLREAAADFGAVLARRSAKCAVPSWE